MIKAVLLDLDNTLLHNPDRRFASEILRLVERHFNQCFAIDGAGLAFRQCIRQVNRTGDDYATNSARMIESLSEELSLRPGEVADALAAFFAGSYSAVSSLTKPMSGARRLIQCLLDQGLLVAIATNPIYPEAAVLKRMAWAGLSDLVDEFAFITHSENMRHAKPDRAYFAETVARVGVEPDEALLAGDSDTNDIQPASALGIHTWHVTDNSDLIALNEHVHRPNWRETYLPTELSPDMMLPQFRGNMAALVGLLGEVKPHQWLQRPDPAEWSILQILCHLWVAETEVHQRRLSSILEDENPFIAAGTPPGPDIPPCHDDGQEVMLRFKDARNRTLAMLSRVPPSGWARPARHSIFGLTNLLEMAHFTAQHDRLHITQLCQTLGKCAD